MVIYARRSVLVGALCAWCFGCAGKPTPQSASSAHCPPGQSFDGQFCQVDQSVATVEQPATTSPETAPSSATGGTSNDAEVSPADQASEPPGSGGVQSTDEVAPVTDPGLSSAEPLDPLALPPATPVDYAMAAQAAPVMHYFASSHLPSGARPLGSPFAGQFAEGQALLKKVQLTLGKCYTIVAMGLPPMTELDIYLVDATSHTQLIKDETSGPQAVVGSRDACYRAPQSGSVSLVLVAKQGQGVAAAQVFQK